MIVSLVVAVAVTLVPDTQLPPYDAFLASKTTLPLKSGAMSPDTQKLLDTGRVSSVEKRLGVPTFFWPARDGKSTYRDLKLTSEQAARRYLFSYGELYRTIPGSLADSHLAQLHDLGTGAIIAAFHRDFDGIKVFNDEMKVVMNQKLELVALSGYLTPARRKLSGFDLTEQTAVGVAYQQLDGLPMGDGQLVAVSADSAGFDRFILAGQSTPVRVRKVWYAMPNGLEAGYHIELSLSAKGSTTSSYYAFVISAHDGRLLYRKNLTAHDFSYRVWADTGGLHMPYDGPQGDDSTPHPTGLPDHYNPAFVAPNLLTLSNNGFISTNDPWLLPGSTTTDGQNASAYADLVAPDGFGAGDVRADVTDTDAFDRTYDVTLEPGASTDQQKAAITQLFYDVNFFHDWYYDVGFDEKAGNAQKDNYGRGGHQADALYAEAQDYSGRNNSDMSTPSDGAHPRMQMYIFDGGNPGTLVIAGHTYVAGVADFGPATFALNGELVLVGDGDTSGGGTLTDACSATGWTTAVTGKIAVVDRGICTFAQKAENAQANGATGIIILNNAQGGAIPLPGTSTATIPVLSMGRADGTTLKNLLTAGTVVGALNRIIVIDRDGTIDNTIVAHEWGHYISNRLIGDGNGISNYQANGMGEGWADFHAMLLVVKGEDALVASNANYNGTYGLAGYTMYGTDTNAYYWGIRRVPYSTDLTKDPLTFKHIQEGVALPTGVPLAYGQNGQGNSEVHATGEVWASMLWECYAALLRDTGRLTFDQARDRMRSYIVASYKITPLLPTFVDARDAVLAAAVASDPTDFALFWGAFAKRGIGMGAIAPDKDSQDNTPVTESFLVGNSLAVVGTTLDDSVSSCDHDGHLDLGETGLLTVTVKNVGVGVLSNITGTVNTSMTGLRVLNGGAISFAAVPPFGTATASVQVTLDAAPGNVSAPFQISLTDPTLTTPGPVTASPQFRVNFDAAATGSITDDVEAPMSAWAFTDDPNGNTGSDFRRYEDSATAHWFFGPDADSPADTFLTSPALTVGQGPFSFTFSHRYQFEADAMAQYDGAVIEVKAGVGSWTDVAAFLSTPYTGTMDNQGANPLGGRKGFTGTSPGYPAWAPVTVDFGTMYAGQTVHVRFRIGTDDAVGLKGWEIDNLAFVGITNRPFPAVTTDPNSCTNRPPVVAQPATIDVNEGAQVVMTEVATDPDGDALTIAFTQTAGPIVTMTGSTFKAPAVTVDTELDFEVVASDGRASSMPVTQKVIVHDYNGPPVTTVTPASQTVNENTSVTLTGSALDPESDPIASYTWAQVSGPTVTLTGADTATLTFTAPEVTADVNLTFSFVASDGKSTGPAATATVTVHDTTVVVKNPPTPPAAKSCGCGASGNELTSLIGAALAVLLMRRRRSR